MGEQERTLEDALQQEQENTADVVDFCRLKLLDDNDKPPRIDLMNLLESEEDKQYKEEVAVPAVAKNTRKSSLPCDTKSVRRFQFRRPQILRSKSVDALLLNCRCDRKVSELFKSFERLDCGANERVQRQQQKELLPSDLMTRSEIIGTRAQSQLGAGPGRRAVCAVARGLRRLVRRHCSSLDISTPDPEFRVAYLGNVVTGWAKGDGCVDKPLATLWRNYTQSSRPNVAMTVSVATSGLKATTKQHGLTEYWAHRITHCSAPAAYPRLFCWVYRHEGRKLKHELRCHAVFCSRESAAGEIAVLLQQNLARALSEFRREKISRQNARLSLANSVYENPSLPRRKILLSVGGNNYRPPLERSKSAPKLVSIEENVEEEQEEDDNRLAPQERCCQNNDIFPSYTLGRRRCPKGHSIRRHRPRLNSKSSTSETLTEKTDDEVKEEDQCEEQIQEEEDDVFFDLLTTQTSGITLQIITTGDSDEGGSISSGCETASTVTASDVENGNTEKRSNQGSVLDGDISPEGEVQLEPFGETGDETEFRRSFRRSFKKSFKRNAAVSEITEFVQENGVVTGFETTTDEMISDVLLDSDGEFSDESGYAELLDAKCRTLVQNKRAVLV